MIDWINIITLYYARRNVRAYIYIYFALVMWEIIYFWRIYHFLILLHLCGFAFDEKMNSNNITTESKCFPKISTFYVSHFHVCPCGRRKYAVQLKFYFAYFDAYGHICVKILRRYVSSLLNPQCRAAGFETRSENFRCKIIYKVEREKKNSVTHDVAFRREIDKNFVFL